MPAMTPTEIDAFLSSDVLCRLACVDPGGHPYVVPCWFTYADGSFSVVPRARSAWAGYLVHDLRVSLCIDAEDGRRVLVQGVARLAEEPNVGGRWGEIAREMAVLGALGGPLILRDWPPFVSYIFLLVMAIGLSSVESMYTPLPSCAAPAACPSNILISAAGGSECVAGQYSPDSGTPIDIVGADVAKDVDDFPRLGLLFDVECEDVLESDVAFPNPRMPLHFANPQ